ncbi:MAG TPA: radical SAM protein [Deltaproteobacteria bacterium]|nr:radical SAM protein [Deltaproteobacteria bacterium]
MVLKKTQSLCPVCLERIDAEIVEEEEGVYLTKTCINHGNFKTALWKGSGDSFLIWDRDSENGGGPGGDLSKIRKGCPYDCGPCLVHTGGICVALVEVTHRCNMKCPICFASSPKDPASEPDIETIKHRYKIILKTGATPPLQLSGGEPTLRDDLPEIVAAAKDLGFEMIQINTNGLRLAEDRGYLSKLKENGVKVLYLQFDGVTDDVYRAIRGVPLADTKIKVIENCSNVGLGVVLVPTIVPGINDRQIGRIVQFAKQWMPVVRGVHFQPISYFGRYPQAPTDTERITLPEVLNALEKQTDGEVRVSDFKPRRSKDAHCAFAGFFVLGDDGALVSAFSPEVRVTAKSAPAVAVRNFLETYWSPVPKRCSCQPCLCEMDSVPDELLNWVQGHSLTISGMPFQDVWNIDLERLAGCCIHVVTDERLVPFCAYYLTSISGKRLYN